MVRDSCFHRWCDAIAGADAAETVVGESERDGGAVVFDLLGEAIG
jgi:hypothetical protein